MKDQYFGDINDYRKYGILRCFGWAGLKVGVCWMLTPSDASGEGRETKYLSQPEQFRCYDPELFDGLASAVGAGRRAVSEAQPLLPGAIFYDVLMPARGAARVGWFERALRDLGAADVIFFDPDKGLEADEPTRGSGKSQKHLSWSEVEATWRASKSLLIFHYNGRPKGGLLLFNETQARRLLRLPGASVVHAIRTPKVLFLFVPQPAALARAEHAITQIPARWASGVSAESFRSG